MARSFHPQRTLQALALAALLLGATACTTGAVPTEEEADAAGCSPRPGVTAAAEFVEGFTGEVDFVAPDGAAPFDAGALRGQGKRVLAIPIGSQFALAQSFIRSWEQIFGDYGVKMDTYANQGTPTEWSAGVQQAIAQGYDAILLLGNNPRAFTPAITEANQAGVPVFDVSSQVKATGPAPGAEIEGVTYPARELQGTLDADWVIADSCGDANLLMVTSNDTLDNAPHSDAAKAAFAENCPDCTVSEVNVPSTEWGQKVQGTVQSVLVADPTIGYIVSCCDSMSSYISPAISAAGRAGAVKFVAANGTPAALDALREGSDLVMTVGEDIACFTAISADNVMRSLSGRPTVENVDERGWAIQAVRIFDRSTAAEAGVPASFSAGYGGSCMDTYRSIWSGS